MRKSPRAWRPWARPSVLTNLILKDVLASGAVYATDDVANSDIAVTGTVSGSYIDTQSSDNVCESIQEIESASRQGRSKQDTAKRTVFKITPPKKYHE